LHESPIIIYSRVANDVIAICLHRVLITLPTGLIAMVLAQVVTVVGIRTIRYWMESK